MQYKRILMSCLIVILILCTSMVAIGAADQTAPLELAVEVSSSTAVSEEPFVLEAGDSIEVSISIDSNPGVKAFELWLKYDPAALTLVKKDGEVDFTLGSVGKDLDLVVRERAADIVQFAAFPENELTATGKIATIKFTVKEGYHGTLSLALVRTELMSSGFDLYDVKVTNKAETLHVHKFTAAPTVKEASCTEAATSTYKCDSCKEDVVVTTAPALGHDYSTEWTVDTAPTCTTEGSKSHHCTRCVDKADVTVVPVVDHTYTDWTIEKEATCTEAGSKHHLCTVCGAKLDVTPIEKIGHTPVDYEDVDPTKDSVGYYGGKYCSVCNEVLEERTELPKVNDYTWLYILVAVVVVVAIGGGVCAYFFIFKKKNVR